MALGSLRNYRYERYHFETRLWLVAIGVALCFLALFLRLAYLQMIQHRKYQTLADSNHTSLLPIPPQRGTISDRNGTPLAINHAAYSLEISDMRLLNTLDPLVTELGRYVDITARDLRTFYKRVEERRYSGSLPIKTRLSDLDAARFATNAWRFPGVELKARLVRRYPYTQSASHLVGYIGRITQPDQERIAQSNLVASYRGLDHLGKFGLEKSYEKRLHGQPGFDEVEIDANGYVVRVLRHIPAVDGENLRLTIDLPLQQVAEQAFGDHRGALVALDPDTGEVLALVSRPGFDPNLFVDGIDLGSWRKLNDDAARPLNNRAIQGSYAPGSTFKPFMALAALETGKRTPQWAMRDPGSFSLGNYTWRDDKRGGHGLVNLYTSIAQSCDTYYYMLANDMGIDLIAQSMARLGLGSLTGIDLPGEKTGLLPTVAWKEQVKKTKWVPGDTISIGIGQGFNSYTPIQMVQATAMLANGGKRIRPHLVQSFDDAEGKVQQRVDPELIEQQNFSPANLAEIRRAMIGVTRAGGTAASAFIGARYVSAGKTGTAQLFNLKGARYDRNAIHHLLHDNAWYIAYAPAEQPRIALALIVENAGFGAVAAAPIARQVFDRYLQGKNPSGSALPRALQPAEANEETDEATVDETSVAPNDAEEAQESGDEAP